MKSCEFVSPESSGNLEKWARKTSCAALLVTHVLSCTPGLGNKKSTASNKSLEPNRSLKSKHRLKKQKALEKAEFRFYKDPRMVCVKGDRGVKWIRDLFKTRLKGWVEKFCLPEGRPVYFDADISESDRRKGLHPAQCVACDEKDNSYSK